MEGKVVRRKKLERKEGKKNKRRKWRAPPEIEGRPLIQNGKGEEKKKDAKRVWVSCGRYGHEREWVGWLGKVG